MKHTHLLFLCLFFVVVACKNETKVEALKEKIEKYAFSDSIQIDVFKIILVGKKTDEMNVVFTITNFEGKEIYKEEITAKQLLKNFLAGEDLKKESDKITFLNDYVNEFFDEEHFLEPAVISDQELDINTPDKAFHEELKKTQLNGFYYSLSKDKSIYIAWSNLEKKVKIYYQCC